jgi:glucokinase
MILAGDIGGANTRLGLFEVRDGFLVSKLEKDDYKSPKYSGLEEIVRLFLGRREVRKLLCGARPPEIERACFGIPGPIHKGRVQPPNLPGWEEVNAAALQRDLGIPEVRLLNDLEANAHGIPALKPKDLVTLNPGAADAVGNRAVISVGRGLGEAGVYWDGQKHCPFACEGGHADFAPRDERETDLLHWLRRQPEMRRRPKDKRHVSYELVLSGPGQHEIYKFLRERSRTPEPAWLTQALRRGDPPAVVTQAGLKGQCPVCAAAVDMFVSFYGAEAGNLALKLMARGGVYIGGGIAPKILDKLQSPVFLEAFTGKGRMRDQMKAMPVRVILEPRTALLGAARCAALLA